MKHILLFGAGKSATYLIRYLKELATDCSYTVTIADNNHDLVKEKAGDHPLVDPVVLDVLDGPARMELIRRANVVISLLPPHLHYQVALDCLAAGRHLLTASYIDDKIKALQKDIENKGLLFLCEMGLDPGIDHMSAMEMIDRIKGMGGKISSFKSHCGGLVAPESDDNPWHYKISWNPRNVILAGKAGAVYRQSGLEKHTTYEQIFSSGEIVNVGSNMRYAYYPNRDSLSYIPLYKLEEASTFIRTTLRHPDFCFGWQHIINLRLTDDDVIYNTNGLSIANFFKEHFTNFGFNEWLNEMLTLRLSLEKDLLGNLKKLNKTATIKSGRSFSTVKMQEASLILEQLFFLGLDDDELINNGKCTAAEVLQFLVEKKLFLQPADKDMVVMLHEIEYTLAGVSATIKSSLVVKGEDSINTAMAKTVGLPLGIAAKLILGGKFELTGLQIPTCSYIYNAVLPELEKHGIIFTETVQ